MKMRVSQRFELVRTALEHVAPDRIEIREVGYGGVLVGLCFTLAGASTALAGMGVLSLGEGDGGPSYLQVAVSLPFLAVGAAALFGRARVTLDRALGEVVVERCLPVPRRRRVRRLSEFDHVALCLQRGDFDTSDSYLVTLHAIGVEDELVLNSTGTHGASQAFATELAQFLRFPLEDHVATTPDIRPPPARRDV